MTFNDSALLVGSSGEDSSNPASWRTSIHWATGDDLVTYAEQLRDPRWQRLRLQAMEDSGWACDNCGSKDKTFNVHHKFYVKGRKPWEYDLDDLKTLCEDCHKDHHRNKALLDQLIANADLNSLLPVIAGYLRVLDPEVDAGLAYECRELGIEEYTLGLFAGVAALTPMDELEPVFTKLAERPKVKERLRGICLLDWLFDKVQEKKAELV